MISPRSAQEARTYPTPIPSGPVSPMQSNDGLVLPIYPQARPENQLVRSSISMSPPMLPPIQRVSDQFEGMDLHETTSPVLEQRPPASPSSQSLMRFEERSGPASSIHPQARLDQQPLSTSDRPQVIRAHTDAVMLGTAGRTNTASSSEKWLVSSSSAPILPSKPTDLGRGKERVTAGLSTSSHRAATNTETPNKKSNLKKSSLAEGPSVSLAVPYANTTASTLPTLGDRPVQAANTVNGVPKHSKTSTPGPENLSPKPAKRKNMLNPVNLLLRRRSSQVPTVSSDEVGSTRSLTVPQMDMPDDYDPRIRGKVVHDFSAPRPKRGTSYNDTSLDLPPVIEILAQPSHTSYNVSTPSMGDAVRPTSTSDVSSKRTSDRLPIFTEHLDDDEIDSKRSSAINAEALANSQFLSRVSWPNQTDLDSPTLPPFGRQSQQIDHHHVQDSSFDSDAWATRLSDPSSVSSVSQSHSRISSQSAISALNGFPQPPMPPHAQQAPVSPEASFQDRSSQHNPETDSSSVNHSPQPSLPRSPPLVPPRSVDGSPSMGAGFPKHFKSNASRFSFQMAGQDSMAEERLLEERHKLNRLGQDEAEVEQVVEDDDEDFFDENAMYDRDEFDDSLDSVQPFANSTRDNGAVVGSPASTAPTQVIDNESDQSTGAYAPAILVGSPVREVQHDATVPVSDQPRMMGQNKELGLGVDLQAPSETTRASSDYGDGDDNNFNSSQTVSAGIVGPAQDRGSAGAHLPSSHESDNDMYFNDGMIDPGENIGGPTVNEDDFDDPTFLQRSTSRPKDVTLSPYLDNRVSDVYDIHGQSFYLQNPDQNSFTFPSDSPQSDEGQKNLPNARQSSRNDESPIDRANSSSSPAHGLAAYHSALADAAQQAAVSGRFTRQGSTSTTMSHSQYSQYSTRPGTSDAELANTASLPRIETQPRQMRTFPGLGQRDSYSGFDFGFNATAPTNSTASPLSTNFPVNAITSPEATWDDDYLSDDAIISEANADALASDDEGFYGQEFGFYARARGDGDNAEAINGGYFGSPGIDMIERKWSVREPNLTPITERSEFSTRNSFIGPFSPTGASLSSPAFAAQMARMSPIAYAQFQEEGMSLEELMKRKSQIFGDGHLRADSMSSSISGNTGPSHGNATGPQAGLWAGGAGPLFGPKGGAPMVFQYSTDSSHSSMNRSQADMMRASQEWSQSPVGDPPASASASNQSLGQAFDPDSTPRKVIAADSPIQQQGPAFNSSPRKGKAHSRNHSGADSVTYVREQSAEGADRWVLERRRTSQAGLVELVGREVVESGRI